MDDLARLEGRSRVVIEGVRPEVDDGRFPIKRTSGERVVVEADVFSDGHDRLSCRLLFRREGDIAWQDAEMLPIGNDRWRGEFHVSGTGQYRYTVEGWVDSFRTWRADLDKRLAAGPVDRLDMLVGAELIDAAARRAAGDDARALAEAARTLREDGDEEARRRVATDEAIQTLVCRYPDRRLATRYGRELAVVVDRERARFSAWYEMFPRSCSSVPGSHGTLGDCAALLPYVAEMGFDVLYLPPIHPIGRTARKGRNNTLAAAPGDVGSPWAIGAEEGGHTAIHPELGTLEDFQLLRGRAAELGIELALDLAFQCTPDHPWVREHPGWFQKRPDGSIRCAENPPKKYQDIYPLDFETTEWRELWRELHGVVRFWAEQGVRIFRVDNPHTKAFAFWEWLIPAVKADYPDALFLAEAFTRPRAMLRLAKIGFTQSYTYFTWRNTKAELTDYFTELTKTELREYFRPNLWPNTPDILPEYLQIGGRPAFMVRLALAATLGASYGIYGPAFELCENQPREPGSEEYLDSEKYEIRQRDLGSAWSLKDYVALINRVRRENPALQADTHLRFHDTDNPSLVCYSKATEDHSDVVVVVVNLDAFHVQSGWVTLDLAALGLDPRQAFQVHDLLSGIRQLWQGPRNYVELTPESSPAHLLRIRRRVRSERDFDYFL